MIKTERIRGEKRFDENSRERKREEKSDGYNRRLYCRREIKREIGEIERGNKELDIVRGEEDKG